MTVYANASGLTPSESSMGFCPATCLLEMGNPTMPSQTRKIIDPPHPNLLPPDLNLSQNAEKSCAPLVGNTW